MSESGSAGSGLAGAVGFLTVFGGSRSPSRRATVWFPLVGLALGAALGGLWWGLRHDLSPLVLGAVVVVGDLVVTGMLHFDGLGDAADGLLAPMERRRRLEVMRDPRVGGFGVAAVAAVLLLRWSALASIAPTPWLLAGLWCMSRSGMTLSLSGLPYARAEGGLGAAFGAGSHWGPGAAVGGTGLALGIVVTVLARPGGGGLTAGAATALAAAIGFAAVIGLGQRRLGGYTGDVLGAAGVVGETLGLVVGSAHF